MLIFFYKIYENFTKCTLWWACHPSVYELIVSVLLTSLFYNLTSLWCWLKTWGDRRTNISSLTEITCTEQEYFPIFISKYLFIKTSSKRNFIFWERTDWFEGLLNRWPCRVKSLKDCRFYRQVGVIRIPTKINDTWLVLPFAILLVRLSFYRPQTGSSVVVVKSSQGSGKPKSKEYMSYPPFPTRSG